MRKTTKNVALILLFLTLSVLLGLMIYLYFFASKNEDISGQWTAETDMTKQAALTAFCWLQDIEGVSLSMEEAESRMGELTIEVNMTLEQTDRSEGTFRCYVAPESYEECQRAAYEAFAALFSELTAERLRMAGYTGDVGTEAVEELVTESFGMPTVSYLMTCAPALLPSLEELQEEYDGSGTYRTADGVLTRQFETGSAAYTRTEGYIRRESDLILTQAPDAEDYDHYPIIYQLDQSE